MKRKKYIIILFLFAIIAFFGVPQNKTSGAQVDQSSYPGDILGALNASTDSLAQNFVPSLNRLTAIKIFIYGDGEGQVGIKLYKNYTFVKRSVLLDEPSGHRDITFSFGDLEMSPDVTYQIRPYTSSGNDMVSWYRTVEDAYMEGKAFKNEISQPYDYFFETYGYNAAGKADTIIEMSADSSEDGESDEGEDSEPGGFSEDGDFEEESEESSAQSAAPADGNDSDGATPATVNVSINGSMQADNESPTSENSKSNESAESGQNSGTTAEDIIASYELGRKSSLRDALTAIYIAIPVLVMLGFAAYEIRKKVKAKKESQKPGMNNSTDNQ